MPRACQGLPAMWETCCGRWQRAGASGCSLIQRSLPPRAEISMPPCPYVSNRFFARISQRCEIPRPKRRIAESCRAFKMCFMSLTKGKRAGQSFKLHAFLRAGNASVLPPTIDFDAAILGLSFCPPAACLLCLARPCDASHWPTCMPLHLAACWSICAHQIQAF